MPFLFSLNQKCEENLGEKLGKANLGGKNWGFHKRLHHHGCTNLEQQCFPAQAAAVAKPVLRADQPPPCKPAATGHPHATTAQTPNGTSTRQTAGARPTVSAAAGPTASGWLDPVAGVWRGFVWPQTKIGALQHGWVRLQVGHGHCGVVVWWVVVWWCGGGKCGFDAQAHKNTQTHKNPFAVTRLQHARMSTYTLLCLPTAGAMLRVCPAPPADLHQSASDTATAGCWGERGGLLWGGARGAPPRPLPLANLRKRRLYICGRWL